ncbi:MAG: zinc-ribbon domain-containing protein [Clostridia bacterium]|nr:zinc-ribbon domain-containing protein [Clostridia bacterium]
MFCQNCGASLNDGEKFCYKCGVKQAHADEFKETEKNDGKGKITLNKEQKKAVVETCVYTALLIGFIFLLYSILNYLI